MVNVRLHISCPKLSPSESVRYCKLGKINTKSRAGKNGIRLDDDLTLQLDSLLLVLKNFLTQSIAASLRTKLERAAIVPILDIIGC